MKFVCFLCIKVEHYYVIPAIFGKTENRGQELTAEEEHSGEYTMLPWQHKLRTWAAGCVLLCLDHSSA